MPWLDAIVTARANPASKEEWAQIFEYRRRRAKPKFYTDENFPAGAVRLLRSTNARVVTAHDVGMRGHPDENHAAYALKHGYVLFTCDRDYLDNRRFPLIHCPAIVVFDFGSGSQPEMRKAFRCLRSIYGLPQFFDKWVKIDAKRDSWTEHWRFLNGTTSSIRWRLYQGRLQEWVDDWP